MIGTLVKTENAWCVVVTYSDSETECNYFPTQTAARYWAYQTGVEIEEE